MLIPGPAIAQEDRGIGGRTNFTEESTLKVPEGQREIEPTLEMFVENIGGKVGTFQFTSETPAFIKVKADADKFNLKPDEGKTITFGYQLEDGTPPGTYNTALQVRQVGIPTPAAGDIVYAPAYGAHLNIEVTGGTGEVHGTVSSDQGVPVSGNIELEFLPGNEAQPLAVASATGSEITAKVAPGDYRMQFEMPGLISDSIDFSVAEGEKKEVNLSVNAVNFVTTAARPDQELSDLQTATLLGAVQNHIKEISGPIKISAVVTYNDEQLETKEIQQFPNLPNGITEFSTTYRPAAGWSSGVYEFTFQLESPNFTVTSPRPSTITVPAFLGGPLVWAGILLFLLAIAALIWFLIKRRRRRAEEEPRPGTGYPGQPVHTPQGAAPHGYTQPQVRPRPPVRPQPEQSHPANPPPPQPPGSGRPPPSATGGG